MNRREIEAELQALQLEASSLSMLAMIEEKSKEAPMAFYKHSFHDIEKNMVQKYAWLVSWLRAVYRHTVNEYEDSHNFDHKVAIIAVTPKPRRKQGKEDWLAYLNAQISEQIGKDVELVFKKK